MDTHACNHNSPTDGKMNLFDYQKFLKKPKTISRLFCWLFSLVVMGCMVSQSYDKDGESIYGQDDNAYRFGVFVSSFAFLSSSVLLYGDAVFPLLSTSLRKHMIQADIAVTATFTTMYFITFCYLASAWSRRDPAHPESLYFGANNARATICFSLFSIFTWTTSLYWDVLSLRQKQYEVVAQEFANPLNISSAKYTSMPPGAIELASPSYNKAANLMGQYNPPKF